MHFFQITVPSIIFIFPGKVSVHQAPYKVPTVHHEEEQSAQCHVGHEQRNGTFLIHKSLDISYIFPSAE